MLRILMSATLLLVLNGCKTNTNTELKDDAAQYYGLEVYKVKLEFDNDIYTKRHELGDAAVLYDDDGIKSARIVFYGKNLEQIASIDVNIESYSAGAILHAQASTNNEGFEILGWDRKKVRDILGNYRGAKIGIDVGIGGGTASSMRNFTSGVYFNDAQGQFLSAGVALGYNFMRIAATSNDEDSKLLDRLLVYDY